MNISPEAIGITAGILTACSMLPQILRTLREKKASEISPFMLIILIAGTGLWSYYGLLRHDTPIIATNLFSCFLNSLMLFFRIKYRNR